MELAYQEPSSENSFEYLLYLSVKRGLNLAQIEALKEIVNINSSEFIGRYRRGLHSDQVHTSELVITGAAVHWCNPLREDI